MVRVVSWNVNGLRAIAKKNFFDWLSRDQADLVCLQETKAHPEQLSEELLAPPGYRSFWRCAEKRGYSGVVTYCKTPPLAERDMGIAEFDAEGRVQILDYPAFTLINAYFPNSQDERNRIDYKVRFVRGMIALCDDLRRQGRNVLVVGDYNIAHKPIDLARPKDNENSPGYYIEEREVMTEFLDAGYVDCFRHFNTEPGNYTWWSYRSAARERNIGWRIDLGLVNREFVPALVASGIQSQVTGSDHCPIDFTLNVTLG